MTYALSVGKNGGIFNMPDVTNVYHAIYDSRVISIIMGIVVIGITVLFGWITYNNLDGVERFKDSCESFGGNFFELYNTSCIIGHSNCIYRCDLHDKSYSLDDFSNYGWVLGYNKQMCIDDCAYHNREAGDNICVC